MANDLLDLALLLEVGESLTGKASVDLQTVDQGGDGDQTVRLDVLVELLGGGLVEDNGVVGLVLDCRENKMSAIYRPFICDSGAFLSRMNPGPLFV